MTPLRLKRSRLGVEFMIAVSKLVFYNLLHINTLATLLRVELVLSKVI